ncbi:MAG: hypothetical protein M1813_000885, partial [Trichoglossum hirsutum]
MEPGHICPECTLAPVSAEQLQANREKVYKETEEWRQRNGYRQQSSTQSAATPSSAGQQSSQRQVTFATNSAIPEHLYSRDMQWATATPATRRPINVQRSAPYPDGPRRTATRQLPTTSTHNRQVQRGQESQEADEEMQDESLGTAQGSQEEQRIETQLASQLQQPQRRNARQTQQQGTEERQQVPVRRRPDEMPPPIRGIVGHNRFNTSKILEADVTLK